MLPDQGEGGALTDSLEPPREKRKSNGPYRSPLSPESLTRPFSSPTISGKALTPTR